MEIIVYSKEGCSWCDLLRKFLTDKSVAYTEVKIDHSLENMQELFTAVPGAKTVPQVVVDGVAIGGYVETVKWYNETQKA